MAFSKKLLNDNEEVVLDLKPHWWFMAEPTGVLLGAIVVGIVVFVYAGDGGFWDVVRYLAIGLILVALVWFGLRLLRWNTTNFVVTSDRLIHRKGVVAKEGIEIPLERVNTVFFNQTVFERLLGAGDLAIESGGETGKQRFSDIRKPSLVQNEIYRQMEANNARMYRGEAAGQAFATTAPVAPSISDQISQLDDLRRRGLITEAEFADKKAELLKRL
ncbi:MAG: PH domain-containing protein [Acidimicrobiales bacterium]